MGVCGADELDELGEWLCCPSPLPQAGKEFFGKKFFSRLGQGGGAAKPFTGGRMHHLFDYKESLS